MVTSTIICVHDDKHSVDNFCFLITRLMVDRAENNFFRGASGNTRQHFNMVGQEIWLEKGTHTLYVTYMTDCLWFVYA